MKQINLNGNEVEAIEISMTSTKGATIVDLRKIDKVFTVLEKSLNKEDKTLDIKYELEDADFEYMKSCFEKFEAWNPSARKLILGIDEKIKSVKN